jgi:hypothetical protein
VVLDIEISLKSQITAKKQDRIDILLFNKNTGELRFIEAKHYTNNEIRSTTTPKVIAQVQGYEMLINQHRQQILAAYGNYINIANDMFSLSLPQPVSIKDKVKLWIFGFDSDQQNGNLKNNIIPLLKKHGIKYYALGNPKKINSSNLKINSTC